MCVKIFLFKCVYFEQPVTGNFIFLTTYIHKQTVKTMISYNASQKSWNKPTKSVIIVIMFISSRVRFVCSPYLAIKSTLAALWPIMSRCGPQINLVPSK